MVHDFLLEGLWVSPEKVRPETWFAMCEKLIQYTSLSYFEGVMTLGEFFPRDRRPRMPEFGCGMAWNTRCLYLAGEFDPGKLTRFPGRALFLDTDQRWFFADFRYNSLRFDLIAEQDAVSFFGKSSGGLSFGHVAFLALAQAVTRANLKYQVVAQNLVALNAIAQGYLAKLIEQ